MRFEPGRLVAAGVLILAGILGLSFAKLVVATQLAGKVARAAGSSPLEGEIELLGWILLVIGAGLFVLEYSLSWIRPTKQ
jgi:hypothetical protein